MYTIQTFNNISPKGLALLNPETYQVRTDALDPDAILLRSHKLHDATFSENLKAVARAGAGTDNIPVDLLTQRGIPVFYAPGANANAVKELVMAAMLMGYRHLAETKQFIAQLNKKNDQLLKESIESGKKQFVGKEISGKTLGVVGLGNVGVKVANAALALEMNVIGYDPAITLSNALALMPQVEQTKNLSTLLSKSDIITLHVPLNKNTTHLINEENIHLIPSHSLLLNFSREKIISEIAVLQQLKQHKLMGYITDFPTVDLADQPNALCFPHLGASTIEAEQNSATMVVHNLCNYLQYGIIEHSVNFPNISLPWQNIKDYYRIIIFNQNAPGIISEVSQCLSNMGYNIEQMENKSCANVAVMLIDLSGPEEKIPMVLNKLKAIPKVKNAIFMQRIE